MSTNAITGQGDQPRQEVSNQVIHTFLELELLVEKLYPESIVGGFKPHDLALFGYHCGRLHELIAVGWDLWGSFSKLLSEHSWGNAEPLNDLILKWERVASLHLGEDDWFVAQAVLRVRDPEMWKAAQDYLREVVLDDA